MTVRCAVSKATIGRRVRSAFVNDTHLEDVNRTFDAFYANSVSDEELLALVPERTLLVFHGAYGIAVWHVAAYLGQNRVLQYSPRGCRIEPLTDSRVTHDDDRVFVNHARMDSQKCTYTSATIRAMIPHDDCDSSLAYNRSFPSLETTEERIKWVLVNLTPTMYDLFDLNCEHVARYVLTNCAVSRQTNTVASIPGVSIMKRVTKNAVCRRRLVHSMRMLLSLLLLLLFVRRRN